MKFLKYFKKQKENPKADLFNEIFNPEVWIEQHQKLDIIDDKKEITGFVESFPYEKDVYLDFNKNGLFVTSYKRIIHSWSSKPQEEILTSRYNVNKYDDEWYLATVTVYTKVNVLTHKYFVCDQMDGLKQLLKYL